MSNNRVIFIHLLKSLMFLLWRVSRQRVFSMISVRLQISLSSSSSCAQWFWMSRSLSMARYLGIRCTRILISISSLFSYITFSCHIFSCSSFSRSMASLCFLLSSMNSNMPFDFFTCSASSSTTFDLDLELFHPLMLIFSSSSMRSRTRSVSCISRFKFTKYSVSSSGKGVWSSFMKLRNLSGVFNTAMYANRKKFFSMCSYWVRTQQFFIFLFSSSHSSFTQDWMLNLLFRMLLFLSCITLDTSARYLSPMLLTLWLNLKDSLSMRGSSSWWMGAILRWVSSDRELNIRERGPGCSTLDEVILLNVNISMMLFLYSWLSRASLEKVLRRQSIKRGPSTQKAQAISMRGDNMGRTVSKILTGLDSVANEFLYIENEKIGEQLALEGSMMSATWCPSMSLVLLAIYSKQGATSWIENSSEFKQSGHSSFSPCRDKGWNFTLTMIRTLLPNVLTTRCSPKSQLYLHLMREYFYENGCRSGCSKRVRQLSARMAEATLTDLLIHFRFFQISWPITPQISASPATAARVLFPSVRQNTKSSTCSFSRICEIYTRTFTELMQVWWHYPWLILLSSSVLLAV